MSAAIQAYQSALKIGPTADLKRKLASAQAAKLKGEDEARREAERRAAEARAKAERERTRLREYGAAVSNAERRLTEGRPQGAAAEADRALRLAAHAEETRNARTLADRARTALARRKAEEERRRAEAGGRQAFDDFDAHRWIRMLPGLHVVADRGGTRATEAKVLIARARLHGWGVLRDPRRALRDFEQAARTGNAEAHYFKGACYEYGLGTTVDLPKAAEAYRAAADRGNAKGMAGLAALLRKNYPLKRDLPQAQTLDKRSHPLLLKQAQRGDLEAAFLAGMQFYLGRGAKASATTAVKWLRTGADQGVARAQFKLGSCCRYGCA